MRLTKEERFTLYCIMLSDFENCLNKELAYTMTDGFCYYLANEYGIKDTYNAYDDIIEQQLPELKRKKPKKVSFFGLWFPSNKYRQLKGLESRIELLKKCIEETHP
jgi:uncharacterized protein YydD (DUF2326 family)